MIVVDPEHPRRRIEENAIAYFPSLAAMTMVVNWSRVGIVALQSAEHEACCFL
jgi:hypothetical protein